MENAPRLYYGGLMLSLPWRDEPGTLSCSEDYGINRNKPIFSKPGLGQGF